jgi:NhaA family Na+:H+ antiporter
VRGRAVLEQLEHRLHPLSSYLAVPLFALANAGVPLGAETLGAAVASPVAWGAALGLLAGKAIGITLTSLAALRLGIGSLPEGMSIRHVLGVATLGGIGFTVSLFIAELAFEGTALLAEAKIGILAGSVASSLAGAALLWAAGRPGPADGPANGSAGGEAGPAVRALRV